MTILVAILFLIALGVVFIPSAPKRPSAVVEVEQGLDDYRESWWRAFRCLEKNDRYSDIFAIPLEEDPEVVGELVSRDIDIPTVPTIPTPDAPLLAIVVDDCGANLEMAKELVALKLPLTLAIIPHLKYSESTAALAVSHDVPFLVHVPMQALVDPDGLAGKRRTYAIGIGMSEEAIRRALVEQVEPFPEAFGINNHRGSRATSDARTMTVVMEVLKERDLFFLDSKTSGRSVAHKTALAAGLRTTVNNYFLDNESDREKVAAQVRLAISGAAKRGRAVAICHLRPETLAYLKTVSAANIEKEYGVRLTTLPDYMEGTKGDVVVDKKN